MNAHKSYRIGKSRSGKGLFAVEPFHKGERVIEYVGRRIPTREADKLKTRYLFDLEDGTTIDGSARTNAARWINHSCDPNCEARIEGGRVFVYALRGIAAGEEITIDYGDEYFDTFIRPAGCTCAKCAPVL